MDQKAQRRAGLKLALAAHAANTEAAIKDESSCYETILNAAVADVGLDEAVAQVLKGDPEWASQMLQHVPGLGAHREALLKKAAESPASALHALRFAPDLGAHQAPLVLAAGPSATSIGSISAIHLKDSGGFDCQFTLFWMNGGQQQPKTGYPNGTGVVWSNTLLLGQSQTMACRVFALPNAPLNPGDEVWLKVSVKGGKDNESPLRFTYDPGTVNCAEFAISGTTTDNTLGYSGMGAAAPVVSVSVSGSGASYSPDEVEVHRSYQTGVQWKMATDGYVFTGIDIAGDVGHDFGTPAISEDGTIMTVTDTVADLGTYSYTVNYKNSATGEAGSFDPGVKNMP